MKEKVRAFAKEEFQYELPEIVLSEETIHRTVEAGGSITGQLSIKNSLMTAMKGVVYSGHRLFRIQEKSFTGEENEIHYEFSAKNLNPGETVNGYLSIISNCGEHKVAFSIQVEPPFFITSMGKIKDLFHFTNLAKLDWIEAVRLFKSEDFGRILLKEDAGSLMLYESLVKSVSTSHGLEEFLIAVHKKLKINFSLDRTEGQYKMGSGIRMDKVSIKKDNWGYGEIRVSADAPFLVPERKLIWTDNFIGNHYDLEFELNPAKMRSGKNYGKITIKTPYQQLEFFVLAHKNPDREEKNTKKRQIQKYQAAFLNTYLEFRMNRITVKEYIGKTEQLTAGMVPLEESGDDRDLLFVLMKTHIAIIDSREEKTRELLAELFRRSLEEKGKIVEHCACLYLEALLSREERVVQIAFKKIKEFYQQGYKDFRILWFLLYLDHGYESSRKHKLKDIAWHISQGCASPILYLEAANLYQEEPNLLNELDPVSIQVMNWAIKKGFATTETVVRYTYLAGKQKQFRPLVFRSLVSLYHQFHSKELLGGIISMLIKGQKTGTRYFPWFELGVREQLRITELHEYYMYSLNEEEKRELPSSLLHYFAFNSSLNDKKKAYLYGRIIVNKEQSKTVYEAYKKAIEIFAVKQLEAGNISENLAIIYEDCFGKARLEENLLTAGLAGKLSRILFRNEIRCINPDIVGVFVKHKELEKECYTALEGGRGQIDLFTEGAEVILVDKKENRYADTMAYTIQKLLNMDDFSKDFLGDGEENEMLLLHMAEQIEQYHNADHNEVYLKREILLHVDGIKNCFRGKWCVDLIDYYYENFQGEQLEDVLKQVDMEMIPGGDRPRIIEYEIIRDLWGKALLEIKDIDLDKINEKRLLRLWTRAASFQGMEDKDDRLLEIGYFIFSSGKYNEDLLKYLIRYFEGPVKESYELWKAANGFEMDGAELEERLLTQALFTEAGGNTMYDVFLSYYSHGNNRTLVKAFLTYVSYRYLLSDRPVCPEIFEIIKKESHFEENNTAMLGLLKYLSTKDMLTEDEAGLAEYNLDLFMRKGVVLPFFKNFKGKAAVPFSLENKVYVEYRANPSHTVILNYILENEEEQENYISVPMKNVFGGIFVKGFTLFYNESLQYYISEEYGDTSSITESTVITVENQPEEEDSKYSLINLMMMTREMQDEVTLFEMMKGFIKTEYTAEELFKPIL